MRGGDDYAVQRRARDRDGSIIQPMTLANMRENGLRRILATCETCQHEAVLAQTIRRRCDHGRDGRGIARPSDGADRHRSPGPHRGHAQRPMIAANAAALHLYTRYPQLAFGR
jgi:hypothetical protein